MSSFVVRKCSVSDLPAIMAFLKKNWGANHILANSVPLLRWQHGEPSNPECLAFAGAFSTDDQRLIGIMGMIPTRFYDAALESVTWLTTWQVEKMAAGVGLVLLRRSLELEGASPWGTVGNSSETAAVYRALGCATGTLTHYFMVNDTKNRFTVAVIADDQRPPPIQAMSDRAVTRLVLMSRSEVVAMNEPLSVGERAEAWPRKSTTYFVNRYFDHPFYSYQIYGLMDGDVCRGLMASRLTEANGEKVMRIIDLYADPLALAGAAAAIQEVIQDSAVEYADAYNIGIAPEIWNSAGFTRKPGDGSVIIPNYFEPFDQRNVDINYAFKSADNKHFTLFKADCDQDRPNTLPGILLPFPEM